MKRASVTALLCTGLGFFFSGCSSLPLMIVERSVSSVTIDGQAMEWEHTPAYINKSYAMMVRTSHDDRFFYLCLSTRDREMQMCIFRSGLTVWLDPRGSDNKTLGIVFPLAETTAPDASSMDRGRNNGVGERMKMMDESFLEMEIIGPGTGEHYRLPVTNDEGIAAKINVAADGAMAYELRVPLHSGKNFPRAIDAVVDSIVGLGIESVEPAEMRGQKPGEGLSMGPGGAMPRPPEEGPAGGMESGGGPQGGGRMMPGRPPKGSGVDNAIKMWWTMKLEQK